MSVIETLLVFIGIPLLVVLILAIAVYGRSATHQPNRSRPGRPWSFEPVWFVPHPGALPGEHGDEHAQDQKAIEGAAHAGATAVGGASGEW
jgi:hypothetical protein